MADDDKTTEDTTDDAASVDGDQPKVTLPDFGEELKSAVQSKLADLGLKVDDDGKLDTSGMSPDGVKAGAQMVTGLMSQMMGALQQAAKSSGVDVQVGAGQGTKPPPRSGDAPPAAPAGDADGVGDNVINLAQERDKRGPRQPSALESRLVGSLKSAFFGYMRDHAEIDEDDAGQATASFNNDFVKNHAGKLIGTMFQAFAGSLLPAQMEFGGKASPAPSEGDDGAEPGQQQAAEAADGDLEGGDEDGGGSADDSDLKVKMNLDLAGLFAQLIPAAAKSSGDDAGAKAGTRSDEAGHEGEDPSE